MKKVIILLISLIGLSLTSGYAHTDTLYVSTLFTTHIIFTSDITYADRSNSTSIASKVIEQNKNMIALKAREPFSEPCSISALESNGRMWTFIVVYRENPQNLIVDTRSSGEQKSSDTDSQNSGGKQKHSSASTWKKGITPTMAEILSQKRSLNHISAAEYDITVSCDNLFSYSDITYITITVKNDSGISYLVTDATFVIESRKRSKRTVSYDQPVFPKSRHGDLSASPSGVASIVYSFDKLTLSKDQVLRVYLYESGGQRNLVMSITPDDINKAKNIQ